MTKDDFIKLVTNQSSKFISDNSEYISSSILKNISHDETNKDLIYSKMISNSISLSVELATQLTLQLTLGLLNEFDLLDFDFEEIEKLPSLHLVK